MWYMLRVSCVGLMFENSCFVLIIRVTRLRPGIYVRVSILNNVFFNCRFVSFDPHKICCNQYIKFNTFNSLRRHNLNYVVISIFSYCCTFVYIKKMKTLRTFNKVNAKIVLKVEQKSFKHNK